MARAVAILLAAVVVPTHAGSSISSTHSFVEANSNPIRRVVTMLEKMAKKVAAEGEEEEALYQKFQCYCSTSGGDLAQSIAEASSKAPQVSSDIEASEAEEVQLQSDLKAHQEDRAGAKQAMEAATAQREGELKIFTETSTEYKSYVDSLGKAISAISKGMAGGFLQTTTSSQMLRRAIADASSVTDYDRQMVMSFLAGKSAEGYVPQSGEITGILDQIKEDFAKNLADVESAEADAVKLHEELMAAKAKQVATLTESIETKTVRVGDLKVEIVNMKNDLTETQAALMADQKFAANLKGNCDSKTAEWDERSKTRAEELVAIHETIKVLNDDDALDLFKKTLPSPSLIQVAGNTRQVQLKARGIVQEARRVAARGPGKAASLDFLALALTGKAVDFSKFIKMIDDMVAILAKETQDDEAKSEYCEKQIDLAEDKGKELSKAIEDLDALIAEKEELLATVTSEIKTLTEGVKELDKSVMAAGEQRMKEHKEFQELMTADSAAKELLAFAKNRLNKFYNPSLHTTTPPPVLSREDQIVTGFGGTVAPTPAPGGIAGTGVEALVQISAHVQQIEAPAPPPGTWDAYGKKGQESTGVISMIDMLVADLDKEMTEAETDEKNAQAAYEGMTGDAAAKRAADTKSIAAKEDAKADAEMDKTGAAQSEEATTKELMATKQYEMELHQECDWLMQNFDLRKEARAGEVEALKAAKATLSGADFSSLAQKSASQLRR